MKLNFEHIRVGDQLLEAAPPTDYYIYTVEEVIDEVKERYTYFDTEQFKTVRCTIRSKYGRLVQENYHAKFTKDKDGAFLTSDFMRK